MKKVFYIFLVGILTSQGLQAQDWRPVSGSVSFTVKMLGVSVNGSLGGIKANLVFNNNSPSSIYASVESATINTSNSLRDSHLKEKPEFFEPTKYPQIRMKSKGISKTSGGFVGDFDVTIKNVTKTVKVPFSFSESGDSGTFKSLFTLDRTDFNFGGNTFGMSDDVKINITLNVKK